VAFGNHKRGVEGVSLLGDNDLVATCDGYQIKVWEIGTGNEVRTIRNDQFMPNYLASSPDGKHIATPGILHSAYIVDAEDGRELLGLKGHDGKVHAIAYSPDGRWLVTAGADSTALVWPVGEVLGVT
jgi:WD40 repeat protein